MSQNVAPTEVDANNAANIEAGDELEVRYVSKYSDDDTVQTISGEVTATSVLLNTDTLSMTVRMNTDDGERELSIDSASGSDDIMVDVHAFRDAHDAMAADGSVEHRKGSKQQISQRGRGVRVI